MDEATLICATRFSRKKVVRISTDRIDCETPIPEESLIERVARVVRVGKTSCVVRVDLSMEDTYNEAREKAVSGEFTFVAVSPERGPVPISQASGERR